MKFELRYIGEEETLDGAVLEAAGRALVGQLSRDAQASLRSKVIEIRDAELRKIVHPLMADAVGMAIQPTNTYGEPNGDAKTLREVIVDAAVAYMKHEEGYHPNRYTVLQKFIRDEVERAFAKELKTALNAAKAEVTAAVKDQAAGVLAQTIVGMAR